MHSALLIDEVFEVILEHCSDWHRHEYRWTLSQLARTCKALKDPSLDRLWRRLESEKPLFNLYGSSEVSTLENYCLTGNLMYGMYALLWLVLG